MSLAGFSCSLLSVTGGFGSCLCFLLLLLFACFSTFTSQKSAPVSESASCRHAPGRCHSDFELSNEIVLISSLLPETEDESRLKGSHFICLTWFFSFVAIWNNCWRRDIAASRVVQLSKAKPNFKWFFLHPLRNYLFILRPDQGVSL